MVGIINVLHDSYSNNFIHRVTSTIIFFTLDENDSYGAFMSIDLIFEKDILFPSVVPFKSYLINRDYRGLVNEYFFTFLSVLLHSWFVTDMEEHI